MKKMNPVVHFEMPTKDKKRVAKFYSEVFGWQMLQLGDEMGGYILANTTPIDEKTQRPKEPGAINGGFFGYDPKNLKLQYPSVVIAVEDLNEAMKAVEKAGGKILGASQEGKPDTIPGIGLYISIEDSEGNRVGMLQPAPMTVK